MQRWKTSFLVALLAAVALAQSASEWNSPEVNSIAARLHCSCSCKQDMACKMSSSDPSGVCPVCKMNRVKIYNMMNQGMTESQILDEYVKENGATVLTVRPGAGGMIGPYVAIAMGLLLVILVIRRYRMIGVAASTGAQAGPPVDPKVLEQIDKDLEKLDE
jgi:cytochrome c-type biogenesis protein CcmH/NrfF